MSTTYNTEKLIAGDIHTQQVKFAADTYYRGMPLEYDAANDRYKYLSTGDIAGFFLDDDDDGMALSANEWGSIIAGGAVNEEGIVDDSGDALTISEDQIAAWAARGFYVKRV